MKCIYGETVESSLEETVDLYVLADKYQIVIIVIIIIVIIILADILRKRIQQNI